ncbi:nucleoside deaminase [Desulfosarcina sp. OttesenSCG-928-G10]|nr:nucleoside deaminase [Desulfosarcina sp. OttesenSCG-928-G10]MDL2321923.1 nucleoside deaminase [Desulfosarcina sp. OttesenSCG-928-B08]
MQFQNDIRFMTAALEMAEAALDCGEFPVGCVIADGHGIVARGQRTGTAPDQSRLDQSRPGQSRSDQSGKTAWANETDHAEINTLKALSAAPPDADPAVLTLYCTLEPCLMCFAAILLSGIGRIVYAYEDVMGGGTGCDRTALAPLYRDARIAVVPGVMRKESVLLFQRFFADARNVYWKDSLISRYTLAQKINA